jgi:predicted SprT family Zn-dependent metalloprotease
MNYEKEKFLIEDKIYDLCEKADCVHLATKINVTWSKHMIVTLGKTSRITWNISLSYKAWPLISYRERDETIVHETAHLIAYHIGGIGAWNHGDLWRSIMAQFGYEDAQQYHNLDAALTSIRRKRVQYIADCDCSVYFLSKNALRKKLYCQVCGKFLQTSVKVKI